MTRIIGYFTAFLVVALLAAPAFAQTTQWTVQAHIDSAAGQRREAATPQAARTAAQAACGELGDVLAPDCLTLLKSRSLTSLTAQGANDATYFLDLEMNGAGGRKSYIRITAARLP
jgi:hypothetical protein